MGWCMSEWISAEGRLPGDELLNKLGRCKFLCVVSYEGTMIKATGIEVFMFTKSDGFLVGYKGSLKVSITHWMELPSMPDTNK